jgi:alpha-beta hydrolase superfamily lysophospholipase
MKARAVAVFFALLVVACVPRMEPAGPAVMAPRFDGDRLVMADGAELPLRSWRPAGAPRAVVIALHGMNDYSNAFDAAGKQLADAGIAVYAYDQRGFGQSPHVGKWAGIETMSGDLKTAREVIGARHPGLPVYLLGESMGGAVATVARTSPDPVAADGLILVAPAVWGRASMNVLEKVALFLAAHTIPWAQLSAEGLKITPSDNVEMLRALSRDPLVLKKTRADAVWGLVDLMDAAYDRARLLHGPVLMLYGKHDEIIPKEPSFDVMRALRPNGARFAYYDKGYHMLLRDLQGPVVVRDIAAWIANRDGTLPSGAEEAAEVLFPKPQT